MKKGIILISIAMVMLIAFGCKGQTSNVNSTTSEPDAKMVVYYTCEMHPEVHSDKPGTCPKCGMELIQKEVPASDTATMHMDSDTMMKK
jgi:hypothetical protein